MLEGIRRVGVHEWEVPVGMFRNAVAEGFLSDSLAKLSSRELSSSLPTCNPAGDPEKTHSPCRISTGDMDFRLACRRIFT